MVWIFIEASEVIGAIGLLIKKWSVLAAIDLQTILVGALGYHLAFDPISAVILAMALSFLLIFVFFLRRKDSVYKSIK